MSWEWDEKYTIWLPQHLAQDVAANEDQRFARLASAVQEISASLPDEQTVIDRQGITLDLQPWLHHINKCAQQRLRSIVPWPGVSQCRPASTAVGTIMFQPRLLVLLQIP
jgi:hypothetical protein